MGNSKEISVVLTMENGEYKASVKESEKAIENFGDTAHKALMESIHAMDEFVQETDGAGAKLRKLGKTGKAAFANIKNSSEKAGKSVVGISQEFKTGFTATTLAVTASSAALSYFVLQSAEAGQAAQQLATRLDVSSASLQQMAGVTQTFGVDINGLADGLEDMRERIGEGLTHATGEAKEAFEKMGMSLESLRGKSVMDQLGIATKALAGVKDQSIRSAYAMQIFGGEFGKTVMSMVASGTDLAEVLQPRGESLFGVDDGDISKLADVNVAFLDMKTSVSSLFSRLGSELGPDLVALFGGLKDTFIEIREEFFDGSLSKFLEDSGPRMISLFQESINSGISFANQVGDATNSMFFGMERDGDTWVDAFADSLDTALLFFASFRQSMSLGFLGMVDFIMQTLLLPLNAITLALQLLYEGIANVAEKMKMKTLAETARDAAKVMGVAGKSIGEEFSIAPEFKKKMEKEIDDISIKMMDRRNEREEKSRIRRQIVRKKAKKKVEKVREPKVESLLERLIRQTRVGVDMANQWGHKHKAAIDGVFKDAMKVQPVEQIRRAGLVTRGSVGEFDAVHLAQDERRKQTALLSAISKNTAKKQNNGGGFALMK